MGSYKHSVCHYRDTAMNSGLKGVDLLCNKIETSVLYLKMAAFKLWSQWNPLTIIQSVGYETVQSPKKKKKVILTYDSKDYFMF